jgi:hypothetical protein
MGRGRLVESEVCMIIRDYREHIIARSLNQLYVLKVISEQERKAFGARFFRLCAHRKSITKVRRDRLASILKNTFLLARCWHHP